MEHMGANILVCKLACDESWSKGNAHGWALWMWQVVTCGSVPLESSYQRVSRCVYTSTGLYEYRNYSSKKARENHRRYTWGLRHREVCSLGFALSKPEEECIL